ncbi:MAG: polysaccharide biosynthesis protein [Erysipelotrichaceae bacterium]
MKIQNWLYGRIRPILLMIIDLSVVVLSYFIAVWIRMDLSFNILYFYQFFFDRLGLILLIYFIVFKLTKMDKSVRNMASVNDAIRICIASLIGTLATFYTLQFAGFQPVPRSIFLIQAILLILVLEVFRFSYRVYSLMAMKIKLIDGDYARTLIVGAGAAGLMLLKELNDNQIYKNRVVGFMDDDKSKIGMHINGVQVLGTIDDLRSVVKNNQIESIFVALPSIPIQSQKAIFEKCYETGCKVQILTSTQDMISNKGFRHSLREISIEDLLGRKVVQLDNDEIRVLIKDKIVLVTGAAGSIGSELCRQIIRLNPSLLLMIDINENGLYDLQQEFNMLASDGQIPETQDFIPIITSIRDRLSLENLFIMYRPEIVFHAAAHKHVPLMEDAPFEAIKNNIFGTHNLIMISEKFKVQRFVSISTDKAVNPTNVMGATKRFVEKMIQSMRTDGKTKFVAVRFGNVLGSNGSIIPLFKKQIDNGGPLTITDKNIIRYFMTIPEAVSLVLQAATIGKGGEIFVLDMGQPVRILDLAEKMIRLAGYTPYFDIDIKEIGLRKGEKMFEELHLNKEEVTQTSNKLIFIAQAESVPSSFVNQALDEMSKIVFKEGTTDEDAINVLVKYVDNYVPNRKGFDVCTKNVKG